MVISGINCFVQSELDKQKATFEVEVKTSLSSEVLVYTFASITERFDPKAALKSLVLVSFGG